MNCGEPVSLASCAPAAAAVARRRRRRRDNASRTGGLAAAAELLLALTRPLVARRPLRSNSAAYWRPC